MARKNDLKMAVISGAANALKYKEKNPRLSDEEILKQITLESEQIISKIDKK